MNQEALSRFSPGAATRIQRARERAEIYQYEVIPLGKHENVDIKRTDMISRSADYIRETIWTNEDHNRTVEYDMDLMDRKWLLRINELLEENGKPLVWGG